MRRDEHCADTPNSNRENPPGCDKHTKRGVLTRQATVVTDAMIEANKLQPRLHHYLPTDHPEAEGSEWNDAEITLNKEILLMFV